MYWIAKYEKTIWLCILRRQIIESYGEERRELFAKTELLLVEGANESLRGCVYDAFSSGTDIGVMASWCT
jgi:hypothetical protein